MLSWIAAFALTTALLPAGADAAELVMFDQGGCVWCQRWDRDIGAVYDKTAEAKRLPLRRIDIRNQTESRIKLDTPVRYTPTFIVTEEGREVGRITGYINDDSFWGQLGKLAAKLAPPADKPKHPYKQI